MPKSSIRLFTVWGIDVHLHTSFILFFGLLLLIYGLRDPLGVVLEGALIITLVFSFVLVHELAHSLVAKAAGMEVKSITLTFLGGIASTEIPEKPWLEFIMAAAGPATNFFFAGLGILLLIPYTMHMAPEAIMDAPSPSLLRVILTVTYINVILGAFNLLPGFPMDGGRILRSLLASRMEYLTATEVAVKVGQYVIFPLLFVAGILTGNMILTIIPVFLYFAGANEIRAVKLKHAIRGLAVREVAGPAPQVDADIRLRDFLMQRQPLTRYHLVRGEGGRLAGVLDLESLKRLPSHALGRPVGELAETRVHVINADSSVEESLKYLLGHGLLLVADRGRVTGILTPEHIIEEAGIRH